MNLNRTPALFILVVLILIAFYFVFMRKSDQSDVTPVTATTTQSNVPVDTSTVAYQGNGYGLRYPIGYTVDEGYAYTGLGPSETILGVKFTIPQTVATGTNLSSDTYLSVEQVSSNVPCTADRFFETSNRIATSTITENGINYSFASSTGAGAGNRYEERVYAFSGANACYGVRYFIHYGAIENYPKGAVREFDKAALLYTFDQIRKKIALQ